MTATFDSVLAEALALPDEVRLQLVERLIPTIESDPSQETEQVRTIPGAQVFEEVQESLAARRRA